MKFIYFVKYKLTFDKLKHSLIFLLVVKILYYLQFLKLFFSAIGDGEKVEIRRLMLQSFGSEPVYQIALQAAVSIGKIARYDVPKDWPELLPALVQAVQVVDPLIQQRALLVLHHVIKALASKR